jgi:hypothetical protein
MITNSEKKRNYYARLAEDLPRSLKYHFNATRKGAARRGITFSIEEYDIHDLWDKQQGLCAISGMPMSLVHGTVTKHNLQKVSVDRIDNDQGYHLHNIQLVTWQVNCAKSTGNLESLIEMAQGIVANVKTQ